MRIKLYLFACWIILCSNLMAQTTDSKNIRQSFIVFIDSIPNGGTCPKTSKSIRLTDPKTNKPSDFSITRLELHIPSSQKYYTTLSESISEEMKQVLEKLKSGEKILFRITAINPEGKTIMTVGNFTIQ